MNLTLPLSKSIARTPNPTGTATTSKMEKNVTAYSKRKVETALII